MTLWESIYRACWIILTVIILVIIVHLFYPRWREYQTALEEKQLLEEEVRFRTEMLNALKIKQERFHNDPEFLARIARELGMARPDEVLIRFYDEE